MMQKYHEIYRKLQIFLNQLESELDKNTKVAKLRKQAGNLDPIFERHFYKILEVIVLIIFICLLFYGFFWKAPRDFPEHVLVTIEKGESLSLIAENFEKEGVISSSLWLKLFTVLKGGGKNVIAGDYYFPKPVNIFSISKMITEGKFGLSPVKIVIPEGLNSMEIAEVFAENLPIFDKKEFIKEARDYEGFLFPDTYFFTPTSKPEVFVAIMVENFVRKVQSLQEDMEKFGKPIDEVITMASIVEDEARTIQNRRIIAGILWKRLRLEMPLQADVTFKYYNGKTTFDLTDADLEDKDNPYNTYANEGLPPTPISNPGLDSIRATIAPTNTEYLYFLSDKQGNMHYAADFEGHKANREAYLR